MIHQVYTQFTYIVGMIADQNFYEMFYIFYPMASDTAYNQRPKFGRAKHSTMAEGETWGNGPTLLNLIHRLDTL